MVKEVQSKSSIYNHLHFLMVVRSTVSYYWATPLYHTHQRKQTSFLPSYSAMSRDKEGLEARKKKQRSDFYKARRKIAVNKPRLFIQLLLTVLTIHEIFKCS